MIITIINMIGLHNSRDIDASARSIICLFAHAVPGLMIHFISFRKRMISIIYFS